VRTLQPPHCAGVLHWFVFSRRDHLTVRPRGHLPAASLVLPACSAEEVAHLVQALFEDTDLRRDFLHLVAQQKEGEGLL
jgi:hypothetical protein